MSVKQAKNFLVRIATDAAAADKARLAHEASLLAVAKELGYSLTAADLEAAMADIAEIDELSDDELEGVAGGLTSLSSLSQPLTSYTSYLAGFAKLGSRLQLPGGRVLLDSLI